MPIIRPRKFTFFPFLILFKRIELIYMTPCVISFLVIGCLVETQNNSILSLVSISSSFKVTEENLVFETVQPGPYSSFEYFYCSLRD